MPDHARLPILQPDANRLTPREQEILRYAHLSNAIIGSLLGISPHTVKTSLSRIYIKLGADNRTHAAVIWAEREAA